jgi:cellulose synthase/poly-beta-1,6-N-acetylglucosamine synthase-like glycosyltransferase
VSPTETVFWAAVGGVVYIYLGYPFVLFVASLLFSKRVARTPYEPTISIIIAAHNEEAHIGETLENKLALDYPRSKLEIIVASDGSTDRTDERVREFAARGVVLLRQEPRNGKTAAINLAVRHAAGDVLVFSDANSLYEATALRHLASNFADPTVGYVTGRLAYVNPDGSMTGDGCSAYMRYENFVRTCESALGSLVGVNGGIDAVRRSLYQPMAPDDLPDLVLPLQIVASGSRVVYEPRALLSEQANTNSRDEYRMRVRVSLRALWTLIDMRELLDVRRYGFYSLQLLSHKVLRYFAWAFGAVMFASSALLWTTAPAYQILFLLQTSVVLCASLGFVAERLGRPNRWLSLPYYFVLVNLAALRAFVKLARGERTRFWKPRLG